MGTNIINNIFCGDFETATMDTQYFKENNDTKVLLGYIKHLTNDTEFLFVDLDDMFRQLFEYGYSMKIYFHNLKFDGDFILKHITKTFKMYNKIPNKTEGFSCIRQGSNIYEIQLQYLAKKPKRAYRKIVFRCSFKILSAGVEALGKSVGLQKFDGSEDDNFYNVEPQDSVDKYPVNFVEYCKRDVEIVRRALLEFDNAMEFLKKEYDFLKKFVWYGKLTASSISLKLQKEFVRFKYGKIHVKGMKHTIKENEIADKFYFGGYTQFNKEYQGIPVECKNGMCIDINSAHPFSMTKKLPYGDLYKWEIQKPLNDDYCEFLEIYVEDAKILQGGIACLFNWKKDYTSKFIEERYRYVFYLKDFTCYYMREEWEILQKFYKFEGVKIINRYWMHAGYYLKDFVDTMYHFKEDFKKQGRSGLSQTFKIILNGGYGIHAKRWDFDSYMVCENKEQYDMLQPYVKFEYRNKLYQVLDKDSEIHQLENQWIRMVKQLGISKANNKFIASAITAHSRVYLLEAILKLGIDNVLYCDTDSIYMKEAPKNIEELIYLHPYELGAWDKEITYDKFYCKGAKVYYSSKDEKINKAKYSGINGRWLKDNLDYNIFHNDEMLEDANLKPKRCKSGLVLEKKDYIPKQRTI